MNSRDFRQLLGFLLGLLVKLAIYLVSFYVSLTGSEWHRATYLWLRTQKLFGKRYIPRKLAKVVSTGVLLFWILGTFIAVIGALYLLVTAGLH